MYHKDTYKLSGYFNSSRGVLFRFWDFRWGFRAVGPRVLGLGFLL